MKQTSQIQNQPTGLTVPESMIEVRASTGSSGYDDLEIIRSPCMDCPKTPDDCGKPSSLGESGRTSVGEAYYSIGIFDVFKSGLGPSSSHTNGPIAAGKAFVDELQTLPGLFEKTSSLKVHLYGSLALTGKGHRTDQAVMVGLSGFTPANADPDKADAILQAVQKKGELILGEKKLVHFDFDQHLIFHMDVSMPQHPNAMSIEAFDASGQLLHSNVYLSIGGGFIKTLAEFESKKNDDDVADQKPVEIPFPFTSASSLLRMCRDNQLSIAEIVCENEMKILGISRAELDSRIDGIWTTMKTCIERGLRSSGDMPMSGFPRQAAGIHRSLIDGADAALADHFAIMDWVSLYARAVNEENACGGKVITAPTNGACGTLPAVLQYYTKFNATSTPEKVRDFLCTAAAIGSIVKRNASISGAEAGCQAEVGTACSMAAAGLAAVTGGSILQIENAAEIGMEHNLGLTCDPLMGLVQVPCIERNCIAAVKAIAACRMALRGSGRHEVSFDSCVETMYQTGLDMQAKYRETSTGGLAILARRGSYYSPL